MYTSLGIHESYGTENFAYNDQSSAIFPDGIVLHSTSNNEQTVHGATVNVLAGDWSRQSFVTILDDSNIVKIITNTRK